MHRLDPSMPVTRRAAALVIVLAALAFVVAAPAPAASAEPRHDVTAVLTKATIHRTNLAVRGARPSPLLPLVLTTALAVALVHGAARRHLAPSSVSHRRRISDVGDDWRALLLGAPPATG